MGYGKLPSGKEVSLVNLMKFCYDLSETDIEIYFKLLKSGARTIDDLSREMNLSKATISRSLNKLLGLGFIERERLASSTGIGRPKYLYKADEKKFSEKLVRDIEECSRLVRKFAENVIESILKEGKPEIA